MSDVMCNVIGGGKEEKEDKEDGMHSKTRIRTTDSGGKNKIIRIGGDFLRRVGWRVEPFFSGS